VNGDFIILADAAFIASFEQGLCKTGR